jgi:hypothetical protein
MASERLCEGKTKRGKMCRANAMPGSHFCADHDPERRRSPRSAKWDAVSEAVKRNPDLFKGVE